MDFFQIARYNCNLMLDMKLKEARYAALDIETTGINFGHDRICEIGIVVWEEGHKLLEFGTLVNPEHKISKISYRVHGISDEMVEKAPKFYEIAPRVAELLRDSVIIGHNLTALDISFINKELRYAGQRPIFNTFIDTYRIARKMYPGLKKNSLKNFAMMLGVKVGEIHRALPDARLAMKVWLKLMERFRKIGIETFEDMEKQGLLNSRMKPRVKQVFDLAKETGLVRIVYKSPYSGRTVRVIEPLAARGGKIDAYCYLREDFRTFDINRIVEVQPVTSLYPSHDKTMHNHV